MPQVSIGLPAYNRPEGLRRAVEHLKAQTFRDFEVIISDNASPDGGVPRVGEAIAREDARFRFVRQPENRGAWPNFMYTLSAARAEYFMFAADDDLLEPPFIERAVAGLQGAPNAAAWMCTVVNINTHDKPIRDFPSFARFTSSASKLADLVRFLREPECLGKANLIYALFKRTALQRCIDHMGAAETWGFDMATVYAFLTRYDIVGSAEVLLKKRHFTDLEDTTVSDPRTGIFPRSVAREYIGSLLHAATGTAYVAPTWAVMQWRRLAAVSLRRGPP